MFILFLGNDEHSAEFTKLIDTPEVSSCLKTDDFVSIALKTGTEEYNFFIQICELIFEFNDNTIVKKKIK